MVDVYALKKKIKESGMSVKKLCKKAGMLRETFYNRMKARDFKLSEMCAIARALSLSQSEMIAIFLAVGNGLNSAKDIKIAK